MKCILYNSTSADSLAQTNLDNSIHKGLAEKSSSRVLGVSTYRSFRVREGVMNENSIYRDFAHGLVLIIIIL